MPCSYSVLSTSSILQAAVVTENFLIGGEVQLGRGKLVQDGIDAAGERHLGLATSSHHFLGLVLTSRILAFQI